MKIKKYDFKRFLLTLVPAYVIASFVLVIIVFVLSIFRYPLSRNDIYSQMHTQNLVGHREYQGVLFYIVEHDNERTIYIFTQSPMRNRLRLYSQWYYSEDGSLVAHGWRDWVSAVFFDNQVILHMDEGGMSQRGARVSTERLAFYFSIMYIPTHALIYKLVYGQEAKMASKHKPSQLPA